MKKYVTVECRNLNVRNPNYAEIRTINPPNRSISVHSIIQISDIYPKNARKCPKSERSNNLVRISDVFEIRTILLPKDFGLSKIRTTTDFGIPHLGSFNLNNNPLNEIRHEETNQMSIINSICFNTQAHVNQIA